MLPHLPPLALGVYGWLPVPLLLLMHWGRQEVEKTALVGGVVVAHMLLAAERAPGGTPLSTPHSCPLSNLFQEQMLALK